METEIEFFQKKGLSELEGRMIFYMIPKIDVSAGKLSADLGLIRATTLEMLSSLQKRSLVANRDHGDGFIVWNVTYAGFLTWNNQRAQENRRNARRRAV